MQSANIVYKLRDIRSSFFSFLKGKGLEVDYGTTETNHYGSNSKFSVLKMSLYIKTKIKET